MPAKSKDQQIAAGLALKAKKDGTVEDLPKGSASYQMATSMSEKELDKMASTKRKELPKNVDEAAINKIVEQWEKALLVQEEMLDLNDEDGQIATQNSKPERVKKRNSKNKTYKNKWPNAVPPTANNARSPMTNNTRGARVAEQIYSTCKRRDKCNRRGNIEKNLDETCNINHKMNENFDPNSLDLIFE